MDKILAHPGIRDIDFNAHQIVTKPAKMTFTNKSDSLQNQLANVYFWEIFPTKMANFGLKWHYRL